MTHASTPALPEIARRIAEEAARLVEADYVDASAAKRIAKRVREVARTGDVNAWRNPEDVSAALTEALQAETGDLHLRLNYLPHERHLSPEAAAEDELAAAKEWLDLLEETNFGLASVSVLRGNVGRLDVRAFVPAALGGSTVDAAIAFLERTRAVIIDLRHARGGHSDMAAYLASHFFRDEQRELVRYEYLRTGAVRHHVVRRGDGFVRLPDVPMFVLVSDSSFSAAEEFAFSLQHAGRATVVGCRTRGGACAGTERWLGDGFTMFLPVARAAVGDDGVNWEREGVNPDVVADVENCLAVAHELALTHCAARASTTEQRKIEWDLEIVRSEALDIRVEPERGQALVGTYGPRRLTFDGHDLWHEYRTWRERLVPLRSGEFAGTYKAREFLKIVPVMTAPRRVDAIRVLYRDGAPPESHRREA